MWLQMLALTVGGEKVSPFSICEFLPPQSRSKEFVCSYVLCFCDIVKVEARMNEISKYISLRWLKHGRGTELEKPEGVFH